MNTFEKICEEYEVGEYISHERVLQGVLNESYVLATTTGKYFVKSVREKTKDYLDVIYGVESLMKEQGIPAVAMMKTKNGNIFVVDEIGIHTLYPFIESDIEQKYAGEDYRKLGEMLGKIHTVGSKDASKNIGARQFKRPAKEVIVERLENYKKDINTKSSLDKVDQQFLDYIDFKLAIIPKIESIELPNDTLIHGDYHPYNVLMDKNSREIIGICDWEKVEVGPRAYELGRSIFYSCFYDGYKLERALEEAKLFLDGYQSIYPINKEEFINGVYMRINRMALSSWIEEKYYKQGDTRANKFIEQEMKTVNDVVNGELLRQIENLV